MIVLKTTVCKMERLYRERQRNRALALKYLDEGKQSLAEDHFRRSVDITQDMKLKVIQGLRKIPGVDCMVAPYEADAQLAFLSRAGLVDLIITEDSDLIPFGCDKVLFKMGFDGSGDLYEQSLLPRALNQRDEHFSFAKFRRICILSGCDYLEGLPGIGLSRAAKFFAKTVNCDLNRVLPKVPFYLKMPKLTLPPSYVDDFLKAERTFMHQVIFDVGAKDRKHLIPLPDGLVSADVDYAGSTLTNDLALAVALGNVNARDTSDVVDSFSPTKSQEITAFRKSIWISSGQSPRKEPVSSVFDTQSRSKKRVRKSIIHDGLEEKGKSPKIGKMAIEDELLLLYKMEPSTSNSPPSNLQQSQYFNTSSSESLADPNLDASQGSACFTPLKSDCDVTCDGHRPSILDAIDSDPSGSSVRISAMDIPSTSSAGKAHGVSKFDEVLQEAVMDDWTETKIEQDEITSSYFENGYSAEIPSGSSQERDTVNLSPPLLNVSQALSNKPIELKPVGKNPPTPTYSTPETVRNPFAKRQLPSKTSPLAQNASNRSELSAKVEPAPDATVSDNLPRPDSADDVTFLGISQQSVKLSRSELSNPYSKNTKGPSTTTVTKTTVTKIGLAKSRKTATKVGDLSGRPRVTLAQFAFCRKDSSANSGIELDFS